MKQEKNDDDAWGSKGDEWDSKNDNNNFGMLGEAKEMNGIQKMIIIISGKKMMIIGE